jgi:hypothetical protein
MVNAIIYYTTIGKKIPNEKLKLIKYNNKNIDIINKSFGGAGAAGAAGGAGGNFSFTGSAFHITTNSVYSCSSVPSNYCTH